MEWNPGHTRYREDLDGAGIVHCNKRRGKPPDELSSLQKTVVAEMKAGKAITIDLDQISSGIYSIECTYGGGRSILRAIVQR